MPEEPLQISRSAWAAVQQLATGGINAGSASGTNGRGGMPESIVLFRNNTGQSLALGNIIGLDGVINTPSSHPKDWDFYRVYKGVKPHPDKYAFAVAMEQLASGKAGFAMISGIARVKVKINDSEHRFAKPVEDSVGNMESGTDGPARIVYRENDSGESEALILFPLGERGVADGKMVEAPTSALGDGTIRFVDNDTPVKAKDPLDLRPAADEPVVVIRDKEGEWMVMEAGRDVKLVKVLSGSDNTFVVRETSPSGSTWGPTFEATGVPD